MLESYDSVIGADTIHSELYQEKPNAPTTKGKGKANPKLDNPEIAPLANPVATAKSLVTRHANAERGFTIRKSTNRRLPTPTMHNIALTSTSMKPP
jgi:hypothetical protein